MTYRVIQWSTGNVGEHALRGIINHPDLELVGLVVHSESKVGKDAGELAGADPVGVAATNDVDAALEMDADVVCYTATADLRPGEAVEDLRRILASGKNVVSSSLVSLLYPPKADEWMRKPLAQACEDGKTSCFVSGIDPGWANDLLPLVFSGFCDRVDRIQVSEILNYSTYFQPEVLFETMGFGKPLDHTPLLLQPGVLTLAWGGAVHTMAAGLGIELDEITEEVDRRETSEDLDLEVGKVPAGTMAGLRFQLQGKVGGREVVVVQHVTRMADHIAPEWPQPQGQGCYRLEITGNPEFTVNVEMAGEDGDENTGGLASTAMRIVNAIPAVCQAEPGLLSALDLPLVTGRAWSG